MRLSSISTFALIATLVFIGNFNSTKAQSVFQIGFDSLNTSTCDPSPVNIEYKSTRMQIIYRKDELNAAGALAGRIAKLGFDIIDTPNYDLPNYTIKLKHDTTNYPSSHISGPWQTVYHNTLYRPDTTGFDLLDLDTGFVWNGVDNIVVDICWDRVPNYSCSGAVRYYMDTIIDEAIYDWDDNTDMCGQTTYYNVEKPHIQFVFQSLVANDAGITGTNIGTLVCSGSQPIQVTVQNFGNSIIDSLMIGWKVNNVLQTPFKLTSALDTLGGTGINSTQATIGNYNFVFGTTYNLEFFTYLPNNTADGFPANDSIQVSSSVGINATFTIGGTNPDFATISAALAHIDTTGICDTVILSIRTGTYTEQLNLPHFQSSSSSAYVIIESEDADSSSVIISYNSTSYSYNYTVQIHDVSNYLFRNITLKATNSYYARVIDFMGNCNNIQFYNCVIEGTSTTSSSSYQMLFYTTSSATIYKNLRFRNTRFQNGSQALYLNVYYNYGNNSGLEITGCQFINQYAGICYIEYPSAPVITHNEARTNSTYTSYQGFYIDDAVNSATITHNSVIGFRAGNGILLYTSSFSATTPGLIANNYIQTSGYIYNDSYGIRLYSCDNVDLLYNSINFSGTSYYANSSAMKLDYCYNLNVFNNILDGSNVWALYKLYGGSGTSILCDFNNIYATGADIINWDNQGYSSLASHQALNGQDSNSISVNPYFVADSSFRASQISHNASATPQSRITDDIEGEPRNATTPDIGADEFTPVGVDAGIISIIPPMVPFAPGNHSIKAVLQNQGAATITSTTINWSKNDTAQTAISWTGSLASGESDTVTIGTISFMQKALYSFKAYTTSPNGTTDVQPTNDTSEIFNVAAGLGGTFTLGGTTPDFSTFGSLAYWLNLGGVYNPVIVNVRDGSYNEQAEFKSIPGADSTNTVLVQSENGDSSLVTMTLNSSSTSNYLIWMNGADWMTWKQISFYASSSYYKINVLFGNGSQHSSFLNCAFGSGTTTSTSTSYSLIYNYDTYANYTLFDNCSFTGGSYGVYFYGYNNNVYETNNSFQNCYFINQYYRPIYAYYQNDFVFHNNYVTTSNGYPSGFYSGYFRYLRGATRITNNRVLNINSAQPYGIYIYQIQGTITDTAVVANNVITLGGNSNIYGLSIYSSNYTVVAHNSILLTNSDPTSRAFYDN